jgi:hypothetical protein
MYICVDEASRRNTTGWCDARALFDLAALASTRDSGDDGGGAGVGVAGAGAGDDDSSDDPDDNLLVMSLVSSTSNVSIVIAGACIEIAEPRSPVSGNVNP